MGDKVKPILALIGSILLILLCIEMLGPGRTQANIIFVVVFLVLLAYAVRRFFKKRK